MPSTNLAPPKADPRLCVTCGAVYTHRRWFTAAAAARQGVTPLEEARPVPVRCPACRVVAHGSPAGMLVIEGEFPDTHAEEVQRVLDAEAARAADDDPLGRIVDRRRDAAGRLLVATTTDHLAQHLGQALARVFTGQVRYDFSPEHKVARVHWHRD